MKRILLAIVLCITSHLLLANPIEQLRAYHGIQTVSYSLDAQAPIDVIIPCTKKDLETLNLCIEGIKKNGRGVRRVIVVSSERFTHRAEWFDESLYPFSKFDVALEIFKDEKQAAEFINAKNTRIGWVYQQFLKFYAPFVIPELSSNVLILDADTIFLNPVSFLNNKGGALFNVSTEHHLPYFALMIRVLPWLEKVYPQHSGISHHMLFQKDILKDFLSSIENTHKVEAWKVLCRNIDLRYVFYSSLSEYEMYFNFSLLKTDQVEIRPLKWENIHSLRALHHCRKKGYHYVSCHDYYRGK